MVSGFPLVSGLNTRMLNPYAYVAFGAPNTFRKFQQQLALRLLWVSQIFNPLSASPTGSYLSSQPGNLGTLGQPGNFKLVYLPYVGGCQNYAPF